VAVTTRLQELRAERGWTQAQLAIEAGVSRQTINSIETGRFEPSLTLALKLARLFDTSVESIFTLERVNPGNNAE
jgi:putative transcriptional regulator